MIIITFICLVVVCTPILKCGPLGCRMLTQLSVNTRHITNYAMLGTRSCSCWTLIFQMEVPAQNVVSLLKQLYVMPPQFLFDVRWCYKTVLSTQLRRTHFKGDKYIFYFSANYNLFFKRLYEEKRILYRYQKGFNLIGTQSLITLFK